MNTFDYSKYPQAAKFERILRQYERIDHLLNTLDSKPDDWYTDTRLRRIVYLGQGLQRLTRFVIPLRQAALSERIYQDVHDEQLAAQLAERFKYQVKWSYDHER